MSTEIEVNNCIILTCAYMHFVLYTIWKVQELNLLQNFKKFESNLVNPEKTA